LTVWERMVVIRTNPNCKIRPSLTTSKDGLKRHNILETHIKTISGVVFV